MTENKLALIPSTSYDDSGVHIELLGNGCNLNSFKRFNSSSRETMRSSSHLGQTVLINGSTPRRVTTFAEFEYGKYTTAITMPANGNVIKTLPKYFVSAGRGGIKYCPSEALIFDNRETGEIDYINIESVRADHVTFGYVYNHRDINKSVGAPIAKDTVLASSNNLKESGEYNFGIEANVVFMSHPACIEDGIAITDTFASKINATTILDRTLQIDRYTVPINHFGDSVDDYRFLPDIGTKIGTDGIVYATRTACPLFGFVTLTKKALRSVRSTDKICRAPAGSIVNDISAYSGRTKLNQRLPKEITKQGDYYVDALSDYNARIREEYARLKKTRGPNVSLSPNLHNLIVNAISDDPKAVSYRVNRLYRRAPLKDYRIEIKLVSPLAARVGHKLTDLHGGKAVAVAIIPTADAPTDKFGTVTDIIIDGTTCNDRINPGRLYEQYINASGTQLTRNLKKEGVNLASYNKLVEWYECVSKPMAAVTTQGLNSEREKLKHLKYTLDNDTHVWLPPNAKGTGIEQVKRMQAKFPLDYGPLTYRDVAGNMVTTAGDIFIGSLHIVLLDKIGDDWAAVSNSKLQSFGLPAKLSGTDKHTMQVREQPVRILGESEIRLLIAILGGKIAQKLLLLASSPLRQKQAVRAIFEAEDVGNIPDIEIGIGPTQAENRALEYIRIVLTCFGAVISGGSRIREERIIEGGK